MAGEKKRHPALEVTTFILGLIMGTGSTITIKVIYSLQSNDSQGVYRRFEKPQTTTWAMFLGMLLALPAYFIVQNWSKKNRAVESRPLLQKDAIEEPEVFPIKTCLMLIIPSAFDLCGTALAQVGLMYCTVSLYQLVRCAVMIIVAILKVTVLKEKLSNAMWIGLFINTVAMGLVSATSFLGGTEITQGAAGGRDPRVGIAFLLLSCTVQGSQYVFEEMMMKDYQAHPLLVVGMEGFWGSLLMPLVVFPIVYYLPGSDTGGRLENVYDSWVMVNNSSAIFWVLVAFIVTVFFYNVFAVYVTHLLSSVWHAILDNFRPVSVWGTDLLLFYVFSHGVFGETWTRWSWIQLAGMFVLFFGTAVFNESIRLPGIKYPEPAAPGEAADLPSSTFGRSPYLSPQKRQEARAAAAAGGSVPLTASGRNPARKGRTRSSSLGHNDKTPYGSDA